MSPPSGPDGHAAPRSRRGVFLVALGATLWATDVLFRGLVTRELSSQTTVFCEHLILVVLLSPWIWRSRVHWGRLGTRGWGSVLGVGWGGSALGTLCYTEAIRLGEPAAAALLQKLQPLFAAGLAAFLLKESEPQRWGYWLRAAVALAAAMLISFGTEWPRLEDLHTRAILFALAAALIWGSSTVFGRYALRILTPMELTALRVAAALPLLGLLARSDPLPAFDASVWAPIAAMALLPGLLALVVYYRGLRQTPASLATLAELCFPAGAALLSWIFLGDQLTAVQWAGAAVLWIAVLWKGPRARQTVDSLPSN